MKFSDPIIVTDDMGVDHRAVVIHTNDVYPDWVRARVTDVEEKLAPKIGDDDIPTLVLDFKQYIKILSKSEKPVPGRWSWRPVPTQTPMGGPTAAKAAKPPKGV